MLSELKQYIVDVPDFPKPQIIFRDISPLLRNHFARLIQEMVLLFSNEEWKQIDYLAGVEARGFTIAAALSIHMDKGFIPIRKKGKLPPEFAQMNYDLEYGQDALEMHYGSGKIFLVDDVLATGGTFEAAAKLCKTTGHEILGLMAVVDLRYLNAFSWEGTKVRSLMVYE